MDILDEINIDELLAMVEYDEKHPLSEEEKEKEKKEHLEGMRKLIEDTGLYDTEEKVEEALNKYKLLFGYTSEEKIE